MDKYSREQIVEISSTKLLMVYRVTKNVNYQPAGPGPLEKAEDMIERYVDKE